MMLCRTGFRTVSAQNPSLFRFYSSRVRTPKRPTKKVPVQLLKDWDGLGAKGEIVRVAPGRMRNQLHRFNGAAYVLPGVAPRIPVRTRDEVLAEKKAKQERLEEEQRRKDNLASQTQLKTSKSTVTAKELAKLANLSFLGRVQNQSAESESSEYTLRTAIESLPMRIILKRPVETSGFLTQYISAREVAGFASDLSGATVPSSAVSFKVTVEGGKEIDSAIIDHIGNYPTAFAVGTSVIMKRVIVQPSNNLSQDLPLSRPQVPLAGAEGNTEQKLFSEEVQSDSSGRSSKSDKTVPEDETTSRSEKPFEWENEFIRKAEKL
jgi:hypothetical protein